MSSTKWKHKGHELDRIGNDLAADNIQYVIIGDENDNRVFLDEVKGNIKNALSYVSLPEEKLLKGKKIICNYKSRKKYVLILESAIRLGYKEGIDFFQGEVFLAIWHLYVEKKLYIDRIEIILTSACTLRCEKCIAFIPYFKSSKIAELNQLIKDADLLFSRVDYVRKLKLLGGDGFLYPHIIEYIEYLSNNYRDRIGEIRIGTNGTIIPNKNLLNICRSENIIVDVSDYRNAVPEKSKIDELIRLFEISRVKYDIKRTGEQWLDIVFPNSNFTIKEEDVEEHFHKCAMFCRNFMDGKLYFCCSNCAAVYAGMFPSNENDYCDFKCSVSKKEILEFELGYSELGHTTLCNVCQGCSEEANPNKVEVAKQL